jgi:hypothetical protein
VSERHLTRRGKAVCPKCHGYRAIAGRSTGAYPGVPATLPCDRCINSSGEVWEDSLTETEKNPPAKKFFERDDNP